MTELFQAIARALFHNGFLGTNATTWFGILILVSTSTFAWVTWYLLILLRHGSSLYAVVAAQLLTMAEITAALLCAGLARVMFAPVVGALVLIMSAAVLLMFVWKHRRELRRIQSAEWTRWRTGGLRWVEYVVLAAYAAVLLRSLALGFVLPPREWDGLVYHLPIMGAFYQRHAIEPLTSHIVWVNAYPFTGELLSLWNLLFLGVDKFVDIASLVPVAFGVLAVVGLARAWGASRQASILGASVFAFAPTLIHQQVGASTDALTAAVFSMGAFLIVGVPRGSNGAKDQSTAAVMAGVAAGLLAGIKYTGLLYACGLLLVYGFWILVASRRKTEKEKEPRRGVGWRQIVLPACIVVALSGYPYIRNWSLYSNPVAPFEVRIGKEVLFPGERSRDQIALDNTSAETLSRPAWWRLAQAWMGPYDPIEENRLTGMGPLWIIVGIPFLIAWLVNGFRRRSWLQLLLCAVTVGAFLLTPAYWVPRYGIPLVLLGSLATALQLDRLASWARSVVIMETLVLMAFVLFMTTDPVGVGARQLIDLIVSRNDVTRSSADFAGIARPVFQYIDKHTQGVTITYSGLVRPIYPLYGADFRNRVIEILTDDEQEWNRALDSLGVDVVVAQESKREYEWASRNAEFKEIDRDDGIVLFWRK